MKSYQQYGAFILMILSLASCVEPYDPPLNDGDLNYLVVDGFLNAGDRSATVVLTRTIPVKAEAGVPPEPGAIVRIEDDQGTVYTLAENESGRYHGFVDQTSNGVQYRLVIRTRDNREYASDFVEIMETPPIDSITYTIKDDGVHFFVNTHDQTGRARHYRWKVTETYEYNSHFYSGFIVTDIGIMMRPRDESIHTCWRTIPGTNIMIASTKHLNESIVSRFPVSFIPNGSLKLSVRYSVLVQQQALTEEAYEYWLGLEKSTETVGGLFDPLPSEVNGNLRSISHPAEKVIGFFSGGTVHEIRRYLSRNELPQDKLPLFLNNMNFCMLDTILNRDLVNIPTGGLLVGAVYSQMGGIIGYTSSMKQCIDCRVFGGTTTKPDFWE